MAYTYCKFTDKGPHPDNQDSLALIEQGSRLVACIADGVGGALHGREAAIALTNAFISELSVTTTTPLEKIVEAANAHLLRESPEGGMVSTFSGCVVSNMALHGVHAGDTRICILRGNGIKQLTEDHTEYFRFYKEGRLTPEDAANYPRKHILENALGVNPTPRIDNIFFQLEAGDRVILTTDGIHSLVSKKMLRDISRASRDADSFVTSVIKAARDLTPTDNYSIIAIDIH